MSADASQLSRREMLITPVAMMVARTASAAGKMSLAIHQNTSAAAGYRASLEGWARAGIKNVEITAALLDGFLKTETLAAAKRAALAACGSPTPITPRRSTISGAAASSSPSLG